MDEDEARNREEHGPESLALLRRFDLNLARLEPSKSSLRGKLKRDRWDDTFLARLLAQNLADQVR